MRVDKSQGICLTKEFKDLAGMPIGENLHIELARAVQEGMADSSDEDDDEMLTDTGFLETEDNTDCNENISIN